VARAEEAPEFEAPGKVAFHPPGSRALTSRLAQWVVVAAAQYASLPARQHDNLFVKLKRPSHRKHLLRERRAAALSIESFFSLVF
jgi:hypothetical protein